MAIKGGVMAVWSVNEIGQLKPVPIHHYRMRASLTHCVLHIHPRYISAVCGSGRGLTGPSMMRWILLYEAAPLEMSWVVKCPDW